MTFYEVVLGARDGILCLAYGRRPFRTETGKYEHAEWQEVLRAWPAEREQLDAEIRQEVSTGIVDVYVCPAVRQAGAKGRRQGDALPPLVCWVDLDQPPTDPALYGQLIAAGGLVTRSGSNDHQHLYLPLAAPVDLGTHKRLNRALAARLGGDAKWPDNSLLRMPGTYNWKPTVPPAGVAPSDPAPVVVEPWNGQRVDPRQLAAMLGVDLTAPASATSAAPTGSITPVPAPSPLPEHVKWALNHPDVSDRSTAHHRLVGACADADLTVGQALTVAASFRPSVEKYGHRLAVEVARSWERVAAKPMVLSAGPAPGAAGSEGIEGAFLGEWESPTPLPGRTEPIPTDALGPMLGPLTDAVGTALQVPTDLVVNLALPIITTAAAGGWIAEAEPGWTEPLCLDTLSALPSGERKSPTLKVLDAPLRGFEQQSQQAARPERAQKLAERKLAEDQVEARRKDAIKAVDDANSAKRKSYLAAVAELEKIEVDPLPRWLADDATPEAVVSLLAEYGSIGVISAEPGLFGILAGRYSSGAPNIEWFLKATSGEAIKVDRMGRDPQDVPNPALSLACCIQPGRLVELGQVKAFRDSGLLARLLYVVPRSAVGERGRTTRVPEPLATAWDQQVTALAAAGRKRRETPSVLPLDEAGRDALDEFRAEIEPHLHPDHGRYAPIADWMNKLPGATVRIAAALTLIHEPDATEIAGVTMRNAVRVGKSYISHAIAAFGLTRPNAEVFSQARQVLATVHSLCRAAGTVAVTRREVHQKLRDRAWVETAASLTTPIEMLCEYGHVRALSVQNSAGGRPSELLELHPSHLVEVDR